MCQLWALHVVIKRHFLLNFLSVGTAVSTALKRVQMSNGVANQVCTLLLLLLPRHAMTATRNA